MLHVPATSYMLAIPLWNHPQAAWEEGGPGVKQEHQLQQQVLKRCDQGPKDHDQNRNHLAELSNQLHGLLCIYAWQNGPAGSQRSL